MYAVAFDIDTECLSNNYGTPSSQNAYGDIKKFMLANHFTWQQGSVYFGDNTITAVTCVVTVQRLAAQFPWFATCVKDVRMLRIEENNDLMPAIAIR